MNRLNTAKRFFISSLYKNKLWLYIQIRHNDIESRLFFMLDLLRKNILLQFGLMYAPESF